MTFTVLLVEGKTETAAQYRAALEREGFSVSHAVSAAEAITLAREIMPYLIVCTCDLPDSGSLTLLRQIRTDQFLQTALFILYGTHPDAAVARQAMELGADDVIIPPADRDAVLRAIHARITRHASVRSALTRRIEELDLLRQIDEELSYYMSPDWVITIMIDWALRRTSAAAAFMLLRDVRDNQLRVRHINGKWTGRQVGQGDILDEHAFIDYLIQTQKSRLIERISEQSEFVPVGTETICMLGIPVVAGQNSLGVLLLESNRENAFTHEDQIFLEQMANRAAVALEYSNLFERLINQMQAEIELREMFGRFISPEIAGAIQRGELDLAGEVRSASVLFCDIRDFTAFCDTHQPQEVVELLNAFLPEVVKAAGQHGGIVNKFGGDSALVIFGAPNIVEDSAWHAAQTAVKIHTAMERISQERIQQGKPPIRVGIGISSGEVIAGAVGPRERQEYTVIGDVVNMAARLQGLTKIYPEYSIFITETTYRMMESYRERFTLATLGGIAIAGKSGLVAVWSILGLQPPI